MTKCFEPDSIDLIKPLAVDDERDDEDDDEDDMDILFSPHNISVKSPYRPVEVTRKILITDRIEKNYILTLYGNLKRHFGGS